MAQLLSLEVATFRHLDTDFVSLAHRTARAPLLLEAMAQPGLAATLQRLHDGLAQVQRALSAFLEAQREALPRLYFVGDERTPRHAAPAHSRTQ
eukprot:889912-Prymnesium_polylepis.1